MFCGGVTKFTHTFLPEHINKFTHPCPSPIIGRGGRRPGWVNSVLSFSELFLAK